MAGESKELIIDSVLERMAQIRKEYDDCQQFLDSQGLPDYQRVARPVNSQSDSFLSKLTAAESKAKDLEAENKALQDTVVRINQQLSRYVKSTGKTYEYSTSVTQSGKLPSKDIIKLSAILSAYEELFEEKDQLLRQSTNRLELLLCKVSEITQENERLHSRLLLLRKGVPVGSEESQDAAYSARLLMEEKELLLEEKEVLEDEIRSLKQTVQLLEQENVKEKLELERHLAEANAVNTSMSSELHQRREHLKVLQKQIEKYKADLKDNYTAEEHELAVHKLQNELSRLKRDSERKKRETERKMEELADETQKNKLQVTDLKIQNKKMDGELAAREKIIKQKQKAVKKFERIKTENERYKVQLETDSDKLREICQNLLDDRMDLLKNQSELLESDKKQKEQAIQEQQQLSYLREKTKSDALAFRRKMAENSGVYKQAQKDVKKLTRDVNVLRKDVKTKDRQIRGLVAELRFLGLNYDGVKHEEEASEADETD